MRGRQGVDDFAERAGEPVEEFVRSILNKICSCVTKLRETKTKKLAI